MILSYTIYHYIINKKRGSEEPLNYRNCIKSTLDYRDRLDTENFS